MLQANAARQGCNICGDTADETQGDVKRLNDFQPLKVK